MAFKVGDRVMLMVSGDTVAATPELMKCNERIFRISNVSPLGTYELKGLTTKTGAPYTVLKEWLISMREGIR